VAVTITIIDPCWREFARIAIAGTNTDAPALTFVGPQRPVMKIIAATLSAVVLSGSLALAQTVAPTPPGPLPQSKSGTWGSTGPSMTSPNWPAAPSPSDGATTGRGPGINPSNPQDQSGRSNPQDLTRPGGSNPQDLK
jgi:hypothetical protein